MRERVWEITMIILGVIAVVILCWVTIEMNRVHSVDCDDLETTTNGYKLLPKQCEKGE